MHPIDKIFHDGLAETGFVPNDAIWGRIEQTLDQGAGRKGFLSLSTWLMAAGIALAIGLAGLLFLFVDAGNGLQPAAIVSTGVETTIPIAVNNVVVDSETNSNAHPNNQENSIAMSQINRGELDVVVAKSLNSCIDREYGVEGKPTDMMFLMAKGLDVTGNDASLLKPALLVASADKRHYYPVTQSYVSNINNHNTDKSYWSVGGVVSPSQVFRTLDGGASSQPLVNEEAMTALNGALVVKYSAGKRWVFESGVGYGRVGQSVAPKSTNTLTQSLSVSNDYVASTQSANALRQNSLGRVSVKNIPEPVEPSDKMFYGQKVASMSSEMASVSMIKQMLDYVEIPFNARFFIARGKHAAFSVAGGLSANFLVGNSAQVSFSDGSSMSGETQNINDVTYSSRFGVGVDVPLMSNLTMTMEPVFRYFLSSANNNAENEFRPYSFGLNAGVSYRF